MSMPNIQQNYAPYNSNNTSQYLIQQSYPNNSSSQPLIVSSNYNTAYQSTVVTNANQSYSISQPQQISNPPYQNSTVNSQVVSSPDNTFIKVNSPYDSMNVVSSTQQGQQVYTIAPTTQQVYNSPGYMQSPTVINNSYQQQPQSQIILNTTNEVQYSLATSTNAPPNNIYTSTVTHTMTQNLLTAVTQGGITPVVLNQTNEPIRQNTNTPDNSMQNNQVLSLFHRQSQPTINYHNGAVITNSPLDNSTEISNSSNNKSTCIYTPLQTPNTSPIKKEVINGVQNIQSNVITTYPPALAQGKSEISTLPIMGQTTTNTNGMMNSNNDGIINNVAGNNELLSPKSLSNESNQSLVTSNLQVQNGNIVVNNNLISPTEINNQNQNQSQVAYASTMNQTPYQSPDNNYVVAENRQNIQIINKSPISNESYSTYTSYNNILSPANVLNQPYNNIPQQPQTPIQTQSLQPHRPLFQPQPQPQPPQPQTQTPQNYIDPNTQNQSYKYQSIPMQGEVVQFLPPQGNVSYVQNSVVQPMNNNNIIYNQQQPQAQPQQPQVVQNQVNYNQPSQMNSNQPIYYNNSQMPQPQMSQQQMPQQQMPQQQMPQQQMQQPQVQQPQAQQTNNNTNMSSFSVPMSSVNAANNVISASSPPAKVKRYKCTECGKRFSRPSSLKTHMYSHTGQHPFKCTLAGCGRRFSVLSNLRRHMKVCQKRHEKNRALILRNAKLSNSKICDDDEVNTTTITIDDINSAKTRVIENKKAKKNENKAETSTTTTTTSTTTTTNSGEESDDSKNKIKLN